MRSCFLCGASLRSIMEMSKDLQGKEETWLREKICLERKFPIISLKRESGEETLQRRRSTRIILCSVPFEMWPPSGGTILRCKVEYRLSSMQRTSPVFWPSPELIQTHVRKCWSLLTIPRRRKRRMSKSFRPRATGKEFMHRERKG